MTVFTLTYRQMLGKKRTLLLASFTLLPVLLAVVYRLADEEKNAMDWTANALLGAFIGATLLPLASLIFGTAALGSEIEDGTAVYLLSKPLPRREIVIPKIIVASIATAAFVVPSAVVSAAVAAYGEAGFAQMVLGFAVAFALGGTAYCCVFLLLSIVTSRAFVIGLIYVFLWEALITSLFSGTRIFSIRQYTLGTAGQLAGLRKADFDPELGGLTAIVLAVAVSILATVLAVRRLRRFEIGETS